ncbi:MAG TPA: 2-dehydropantoate 2-reductase [Paraburkholderia sp.]|jgi:2-dehydropantoate 2-reductase|nr:2-dehydropantoate 2-reductase [Paraburkholderia sp.]
MKVGIYGAGAIGGWLGARLGLDGHRIAALARGATLDALRTHGLRLTEGGGTRSVRVEASADPAALGVQDVVIVAVKAPSTAAVAAGIAPLLGEHTVVVSAMNGVPWWFCAGLAAPFAGTRIESVDPDGAIAAAIPAARTIGCVVHASCLQDAPGAIRHHLGNGLIVGEATGGASERLTQLAAAFSSAGFDVQCSEQIQRDIWFKLWGNMTMNPISALTGATTDRVLGDELVRAFATRVMREAAEIGRCIGIPVEQDPEERHQVTLRLGAMKTSMLQDVIAHRPVEIDALVSAVRELGQATGVATPFMDALLGLSRLQASTLGLY